MASASPRPRPQIMKLTDAAADRVREIMAKSEKPVAGLRIGVKNGGWFPGKLNAMGQRIWASDWLGLSEGMVPWDQILTQLKSDGFTGILTVHGPYEMGLEQAVDQLGSDLSYIRRVTGAAK